MSETETPTVTRNFIPLVQLATELRTSYGPGGKTRDELRRPFPYTRLQRVTTTNPAWRATAGTATALAKLDEAMKAEGSAGLRLTDVFRSYALQQQARSAFEAWVAAGKPQPGDPGWRTGMKPVFVQPPGESFHNCGMAVDFDIEALDFTGINVRQEPDAALAKLWDLAIPLGLRPCIAHPTFGQSEAWHFDHMGPLRKVHELFKLQKDPRYRRAYSLTALVGCVLTGTYTGQDRFERMVQGRLLLTGHFCGLPDGKVGPMTRKALEAAGIKGVVASTPVLDVLRAMDDARVGLDAMAAA